MQPAEVAEDNVVELKEAAPAAEKAAVIRDFETGAAEDEELRVGEGAEAEFMLESTAVCPHCLEDIDKIQIVRMLRTKVNFVSSLPRRGQLLICPKCRIALAGALGGLI